MTRHVSFRGARTAADFGQGTHLGTRATPTGLAYDAPAGLTHHTDYRREPQLRKPYAWTAWVAPEVHPGFAFTELVPSWNASTPDDSWLVVEARVSTDGLRWSGWCHLAHWAETDAEVHAGSSATSPGQDADLAVDVLRAREGVTWASYQLRVGLLRGPGSDAVPTVRLLGAMVSAVPTEAPADVSPGGEAWGVEVEVPPHSQQLHRDTYPEFGRGGESWCSPTSTAMVLERWGLGPSDKEFAWVPEGSPDPTVIHAARCVFDHEGDLCGNWTFNVAYAGRFGAEAFVTRLRSLTEMETLVAAGVPVVATVAFAEGELPGAGYDTLGHLLVVRGFTAGGDVIVNDPASHRERSNDAVRVVYERAVFERVWLGASGGVVYVVHPADATLPPVPDPAEPSW